MGAGVRYDGGDAGTARRGRGYGKTGAGVLCGCGRGYGTTGTGYGQSTRGYVAIA